MAVALRSLASDACSSNTDTTVEPGVPTGTVDGDLLIAVVVTNSGTPTPDAGDGWTALASVTSGQPDIHIFYKTASSESGEYTFTVATYQYAQAVVMAFSGADTTNIDETTGNTGSSASAALNDLEVGVDGSLAIWLEACLASSSSHATLTEEFDSSGFNTRQLGIYSESVNTGTITGRAITIQWSAAWSTIGIGIRPAAAAGGNLLIMRAANKRGNKLGGISGKQS